MTDHPQQSHQPGEGEPHFVYTCEDLLKVLNAYVDGDIDGTMCEQLQDYMARCNPCKLVVDNMQRTIRLYHEESMFEMPLAFRKKLHDDLRSRWACRAKPGPADEADEA